MAFSFFPFCSPHRSTQNRSNVLDVALDGIRVGMGDPGVVEVAQIG